METMIDREFGGERPLYNRHGLRLERVVIHAGESSIKEGSDIEAYDCRFEGKYVFWCCERFLAAGCHFTEGARSSLWHSRGMELRDCRQEAPKMFRESADIRLRRVSMPHAQETFWSCEGIDIEDVEAHEADYIFMNCSDVKVLFFDAKTDTLIIRYKETRRKHPLAERLKDGSVADAVEFEKALMAYGVGTGNTATGLALVRAVDPDSRSDAPDCHGVYSAVCSWKEIFISLIPMWMVSGGAMIVVGIGGLICGVCVILGFIMFGIPKKSARGANDQ